LLRSSRKSRRMQQRILKGLQMNIVRVEEDKNEGKGF
jgi:hypothetical protein